MKNQSLPEVFVDWKWDRTINFILYKLNPNKEFILKAENNRMFKMAMDSVIKVLCEERGFYEMVKKWKDGKELKAHLKRI